MTHDMENLKKKKMKQIQNTMEGHSSRLEQAEDRISELEDEMEIKEKLKNYYSNNTKTGKGICKNPQTLSKDQT
jgi:hypothetical protein